MSESQCENPRLTEDWLGCCLSDETDAKGKSPLAHETAREVPVKCSIGMEFCLL